MFSKEEIIALIENDNSYNSNGWYAKDFVNDQMVLCCEYLYMTKLELLMAFLGKEMTWRRGSSDIITVTIVAEHRQQLLVREVSSDEDGSYTHIEFWLVNKDKRLTAEVVWQYTD